MKNYKSLIEHISIALQRIHSDYQNDGVIKSLRTYDEENILTYGYLRKLIDMKILVNISKYWN